jgi:hypothetical protein
MLLLFKPLMGRDCSGGGQDCSGVGDVVIEKRLAKPVDFFYLVY